MSRLRAEAIRSISTAKSPQAIVDAVEMLPDGDAEVQRALLDRFSFLAAVPGRRDPGAVLRTALLQALYGRAGGQDLAPLEQALVTYEFTAPPGESAGGLRAAALLLLSERDGSLALFHAARLLNDQHVQMTTGEPEVTAAGFLRAQGQTLILYQRLLAPQVHPAVAAACLAGLSEVPASLLASLAERYRTSPQPGVLLALTDLLLQHEDAEGVAPVLCALIQEAADLDVARYAAAAIVASRNSALIAALTASTELGGERGALVGEALGLLPS